MSLEHDPNPPFETVGSQETCRIWDVALRRDRIRWPTGEEADYRVVETPDSVFAVPYWESGTTVLVRQWRHPWGATAWEVPAGTMEDGEDPLDTVRRELVEEAGLTATEWVPMGVIRGSALLTGRQHLYLARGLSQVERSPEGYERDMIVRELPFEAALGAALGGEIEHAGSISALVRAARHLGRI